MQSIKERNVARHLSVPMRNACLCACAFEERSHSNNLWEWQFFKGVFFHHVHCTTESSELCSDKDEFTGSSSFSRALDFCRALAPRVRSGVVIFRSKGARATKQKQHLQRTTYTGTYNTRHNNTTTTTNNTWHHGIACVWLLVLFRAPASNTDSGATEKLENFQKTKEQ